LSKQLQINIYKDPTQHIEVFLNDWESFGNSNKINELHYRLTSLDGKESELYIKNDILIIQGEIPSKSLMIIDKLAKSCESDKIIEGEFMGKGSTPPDFEKMFSQQGFNAEMPFAVRQFGKITTLSKGKMIVLLILALPIMLIMLPIAIIYMIIKIIMLKLNFK